MSNFSEKTQFDYLYDALANKYPGIKAADGRNTLFQFLTTPRSADWLTGNDAKAYDLANTVGKELDGFYVHGDALDVSYIDLINTIKPTSKDINARYRQLTELIAAVNNASNAIRDDAHSDYNVWKANNPDETATFKEWLNDDFGGAKWQTQIDENEKDVKEYIKEKERIVKTMDKALFDAMARLETDTMNISSGGGKAIAVPRVTISGDLAGDVRRWTQAPKGQFDFDVRINARETIKSPWVTTYDAQTKVSCFKASTHVKVDTSRIISDTNYELQVTAVGLNSYDVTRGKWYSPDFVKPDIELLEGAPLTNDDFFSSRGCLHMIPNNILVIYKPKIRITLSAKCYKEEFSAYSDVNFTWVTFFGINFNFGAGKKLQPIENPNGTITIEIDSPENAAPQVLGITSTVVYNGNRL